MKAWYFSEASKKLRYDDNRDIALGVTHTVDGPPIPCKHGLHASVRLLDALFYAPGPVLWEVELGGQIVEDEDGDKLAATERTYLRGGIDLTDTLRAFACRCALDVAHLWDMPPIVRQYLETRDETIRTAARDAARDARAAACAARAATAWAAACAASDASAASAARDARDAASAKYGQWLADMVEEALAAQPLKEDGQS